MEHLEVVAHGRLTGALTGGGEVADTGFAVRQDQREQPQLEPGRHKAAFEPGPGSSSVRGFVFCGAQHICRAPRAGAATTGGSGQTGILSDVSTTVDTSARWNSDRQVVDGRSTMMTTLLAEYRPASAELILLADAARRASAVRRTPAWPASVCRRAPRASLRRPDASASAAPTAPSRPPWFCMSRVQLCSQPSRTSTRRSPLLAPVRSSAGEAPAGAAVCPR